MRLCSSFPWLFWISVLFWVSKEFLVFLSVFPSSQGLIAWEEKSLFFRWVFLAYEEERVRWAILGCKPDTMSTHTL